MSDDGFSIDGEGDLFDENGNIDPNSQDFILASQLAISMILPRFMGDDLIENEMLNAILD